MWVQQDSQEEQWQQLLAQRLEGGGLKALSLWSHVFFLWPIWTCARKRLYFPATMIAIATLVSFSYHTCLALDVCGGVPLYKARASDHLTANLLIVAAIGIITGTKEDVPDRDANHRAHLDFAWISLAMQLTFVGVAVIVQTYSLYVAYVALAIAFWSMLLYGLWFRSPAPPHVFHPVPSTTTTVTTTGEDTDDLPDVDEVPVEDEDDTMDGSYVIHPLDPNIGWTLGAILSLAAALTCFLIDINSSWLHSLWHVFAASFLACLAEAVTTSTGRPVTVLQFERAILEEEVRTDTMDLDDHGDWEIATSDDNPWSYPPRTRDTATMTMITL